MHTRSIFAMTVSPYRSWVKTPSLQWYTYFKIHPCLSICTIAEQNGNSLCRHADRNAPFSNRRVLQSNTCTSQFVPGSWVPETGGSVRKKENEKKVGVRLEHTRLVPMGLCRRCSEQGILREAPPDSVRPVYSSRLRSMSHGRLSFPGPRG